MIEGMTRQLNRLMNIALLLMALSFSGVILAPVAAAPEPPAFVSATTNAAGTVITITFSEPMATPPFRAAHDFTYTINGRHSQPVRAIALNPGSSTMIDLTIGGRPIAYGDTVTVRYAGRTVRAQNGRALGSFTRQPVTNAVPASPAFVSATSNAAGTVITITFSEPMATPPFRAAHDFTIRVNGRHARAIRSIALNPASSTMIDLTIGGRPIAYGDTVTVRYDGRTVRAENGGVLDSFTRRLVANAVPASGPSTSHTVTYDENGATGGTVPVDPSTYTTGATVAVLGNPGNLVREGYLFDGWNTEADGSGMVFFNPGDTFTMGSDDVILYAQWAPPV